MVLYVPQQEVAWACGQIDPLGCVREALVLHARGASILPDEAYLSWPVRDAERARSLNMPGGLLTGGDPVVGTKIINSNPGNPARGLARASGLTLLFDPVTGQVRTIMAAAHLSGLRTACVTALSALALGGPSQQCLALIGAGALARFHLDVLPLHLRGLRRVALFDIDLARAGRLAGEWRQAGAELGIAISVTRSAEAAVRSADLVVPVTTTTEPYLRLDWLRPGALLVNVSLDDASAEVLLRADRLVVDDWDLVKADKHRLLGRLYRAGHIGDPLPAGAARAGSRPVDAELGQILAGDRPGRSRPDEIIVVNPFGLAIEDIALAAEVDRVARGAGRGVELEA
jgi:ornithine cyclodeaminase/alanine dehydrogenase-like protein (mu-crystallin family)